MFTCTSNPLNMLYGHLEAVSGGYELMKSPGKAE